MDTDINDYLNVSTTPQITTFNWTNDVGNITTGYLFIPPIEVIGIDVLIAFGIIYTVLGVFIVYYLMRMVRQHGT